MVVMYALRIGVTHRIEPVAGELFGAGIAGQHPFDGYFVSVGGLVLDESLHLFRRRRQAGKIETQAPQQAGLLFLGIRLQAVLGELVRNEVINGIPGPTGASLGHGGKD